jgi:hypothetical protein
MDNIPAEVLHQVFTRLSLKDGLECMLVCRYWYNILDQRSLLYCFDINETHLDETTDMLERFSHRGPQVEYLTVDFPINHNFDRRKIFNLFPNLRQVKQVLQEQDAKETMSSNYFDKPFRFTNTTKLEKLTDFGDCQLTRQLAMSNSLSRLNSLELDFSSLPQNDTLQHLINMPVLQRLDLISVSVKLLDVELLHMNLPSIKSLSLEDFTLSPGDIPQDVIPASLLTEIYLKLDDASDFDTHIQFYNYLGSKYTLVKNPAYIDYVMEEDDTDYMIGIYNDGIFPLYQKIGSQVNSFVFQNYINGMDFFKKFDEFGMKLNELTMETWDTAEALFLEELTQSQQSKYLQQLTLKDIIPQPINRMTNMEVLETMWIDFRISYETPDWDTEKMDFSQLLMACPATLTTLTIEGVDLTFSTSPPSNTTSIKHLTLKHVGLTSDLAKHIETCFPKLSALYLRDSLSTSMSISLRDHYLDKVDIVLEYKENDGRNDFLVETRCIDDAQYHKLTQKPLNKTDSQSHSHNDKMISSVALKFICSSVKQLSISTERKEQ